MCTCRNFSSNHLSGTIPAELGSLIFLQQLYVMCVSMYDDSAGLTLMCTCRLLNNNQLSGTIPAELGTLTSLRQLYVICVSMYGDSVWLTYVYMQGFVQ